MVLGPDEREREALLRMKQLANVGMESSKIAGVLKREGYRMSDGRDWHPLTVSRVVAHGWARVPLTRL